MTTMGIVTLADADVVRASPRMLKVTISKEWAGWPGNTLHTL